MIMFLFCFSVKNFICFGGEQPISLWTTDPFPVRQPLCPGASSPALLAFAQRLCLDQLRSLRLDVYKESGHLPERPHWATWKRGQTCGKLPWNPNEAARVRERTQMEDDFEAFVGLSMSRLGRFLIGIMTLLVAPLSINLWCIAIQPDSRTELWRPGPE